MRSLERLEQFRRFEKEKKRLRKNDPPDQEAQAEVERLVFVPCNQTPSVFDTNGRHRARSIDAAPCAFDRQATFRTKE